VRTLADLVASQDDGALAAAASKGVVIRAGKDVAAGKVRIESQDLAEARLVVDGKTVTISAKGLEAARCSCPAAGSCRHIVAAVIALRASRTAEDVEASSPPLKESATEIAQLPFEALAAYAGADWPRALALAGEGTEEQAGASRVVAFPDTGETVTFPAGLPLSEAIHKGPRSSRRRLAIAAAALVLARGASRDLPSPRPQDGAATIDARLLDLVQAAIAGAAVALATGLTAPARDRLFSVAITARAEAVPRLAGELRALSQRLDPEALRRAEEIPVRVLADLARTYALAEALRRAPADPALTGTLSREFLPSGRREMVLVGGEPWRTASGARGLTLVLADIDGGLLRKAIEARSAGTDLTFRAEEHWRRPVWLADSPDRLLGRRLRFPDAKLAPDGDLGLSQAATAEGLAAWADLVATGAVLREWSAIPRAIAQALGDGLRRRPGEAFALVAPARVEIPAFDAYAQRLRWGWRDPSGARLVLTLPHGTEHVGTHASAVEGGLIALAPSGQARLLSVWLRRRAAPLALAFGRPGPPRTWRVALGHIADRVAPRPVTASLSSDELDLFHERALEAVLARLRRRQGGWPAGLPEEAEAFGLLAVTRLLRGTEIELSPPAALRLSYLLALGASDLAMTALGSSGP